MYHYVRESSKEFPFSKHEDLNNFVNNCKIINQKYESFNVTEGLMCKKLENKILLTFDDALKDHLEVAEILKNNNLKGTFYIPIYPYIQEDILSVHKAHLICSKIGAKCLSLFHKSIKDLGFDYKKIINKNNIDKFNNKYNKHNENFEIKQFKRIINYYGDTNLICKILDDILKKLSIKIEYHEFYLTQDEIKYIHSLGHEIGSHGYSHTLLSRLSKNEQENEIKLSKEFLEKIINNEITSFCYPYGTKNSYTNETIKILEHFKYKNAVSVDPRDIIQSDINSKFELPRFDCKNYSF